MIYQALEFEDAEEKRIALFKQIGLTLIPRWTNSNYHLYCSFAVAYFLEQRCCDVLFFDFVDLDWAMGMQKLNTERLEQKSS